MGLKRFLLAMASLAALGAITATSASAAAETGGQWYVEGTEITEPVGVACDGTLTLTGSIGATEELPIVLEAKGVECTGAIIFNEAGAGRGEAELKLTGVTIAGEIGEVCSVKEGTITTTNLESEIYMDSEEPELTFDRFQPEEVEEGKFRNFAVVHIEGASCPITGNRPLKGYVFGEAAAPTGVQSVFQSFAFSEEVDARTGGELEFSGNPAHLDGMLYTVIPGYQFGTE